MSGFMQGDNAGLYDRSIEMDEDRGARIVARLMRRTPWKDQSSELSQAIQRIFERWLAGLKDDDSTIAEAQNLARMVRVQHPVTEGKLNGSSVGVGAEDSASILATIVDKARKASGERESGFWARVAAAQSIIEEYERSDSREA